jgi:hypothetical protein
MPTLAPRTWRLAAASVALLGMSAAGVSQLASAALFTDQAASGAVATVAGTVKVGMGGQATTTLATNAMAPGQSQYGTLLLTNQGNLQQRLALVATDAGTDGFGAVLTLDVVELPTGTCGAATSFTAPLYTGPAGTTAGTAVIGNRTQGQQTGDRVLDAGASVTYCLRVSLPATAPNTTQGDAAALTFTAYAEQTANNA